MSYTCEVKEQAAQPALAIRTRSAVEHLPEVLGQAYGQIFTYLGELGEGPAGAPYMGYYNMDMQDLDVEIGVPVNRALPGKEAVQSKQLPGGKVVTCLYIGPYHEMRPAYDAINQYIQEHGLLPTGVVYEIYISDPSQTPPQELQTLIVFPLN
jgi:effector-binding domain-containing protein